MTTLRGKRHTSAIHLFFWNLYSFWGPAHLLSQTFFSKPKRCKLHFSDTLIKKQSIKDVAYANSAGNWIKKRVNTIKVSWSYFFLFLLFFSITTYFIAHFFWYYTQVLYCEGYIRESHDYFVFGLECEERERDY